METLSDKIEEFKELLLKGYKENSGAPTGAVLKMESLFKEFIRLLKEEVGNPTLLTKSMKSMKFHDIIDKLAGEELI